MSETDIENGMTTSDISLLIGGVAAAIASIIYSAKFFFVKFYIYIIYK